MRAVVRMFFCAMVFAAFSGCGSGEATKIPQKFAPMPQEGSDVYKANIPKPVLPQTGQKKA